jgi:hypothetical protein
VGIFHGDPSRWHVITLLLTRGRTGLVIEPVEWRAKNILFFVEMRVLLQHRDIFMLILACGGFFITKLGTGSLDSFNRVG